MLLERLCPLQWCQREVADLLLQPALRVFITRRVISENGRFSVSVSEMLRFPGIKGYEVTRASCDFPR